MDNLLINYIKLLRTIPDDDGKIIAEHFTRKAFKEGAFLIQPDKIAREMFFVSAGVVRIGSFNDKGG